MMVQGGAIAHPSPPLRRVSYNCAQALPASTNPGALREPPRETGQLPSELNPGDELHLETPNCARPHFRKKDHWPYGWSRKDLRCGGGALTTNSVINGLPGRIIPFLRVVLQLTDVADH